MHVSGQQDHFHICSATPREIVVCVDGQRDEVQQRCNVCFKFRLVDGLPFEIFYMFQLSRLDWCIWISLTMSS